MISRRLLTFGVLLSVAQTGLVVYPTGVVERIPDDVSPMSHPFTLITYLLTVFYNVVKTSDSRQEFKVTSIFSGPY